MRYDATLWKSGIVVCACIGVSISINKFNIQKCNIVLTNCTNKPSRNSDIISASREYTIKNDKPLENDKHLEIALTSDTVPIEKAGKVVSDKVINSRILTSTLSNTPTIEKKYKNVNIGSETFVSFKIDNNLYSDARKSGIPQPIISKVISLYKNIINFKADLKSGDIVKIIYKTDTNRLIFTSIKGRKKEFSIYGYEKNNEFGYYNDAGICLNKDTFLIPVQGARVSSKFGVRVHPVKKIRKIHQGTDFAAKTGTPIMASNSGRVAYVGHRGGYGKCIIIRHSNGYKTLYGHMSKYADQIFVNKSVSKGDIIGYVGRTGVATGPHLHFEIIKNNVRINPEKANLISLSDLTKLEKVKFDIHKKNIRSKINSTFETY